MAAARGLKHWRVEHDADGVAWLRFDQADARANTLGEETLGELARALDAVEAEAPAGLVILSDNPAGFIAGADVRAFGTLRDRGQALQAIRQGQSAIDRLARLRFPTVALIHGHCLGGGLELALACRYRIAEREASLGLPEVRLGIHPGFGGSVRLPRLIGVPAAMDLMLSGRTVRGRAAARLGLVDHAVPERQLRSGARSLVHEAPPRRRPGRLVRLAGWPPVRPLLAWYLRRKLAERADPRHYPAPYALIETWRHQPTDTREALRREAASVAELITGPTSRNLVHVFFLRERLRGLARPGEGKARGGKGSASGDRTGGDRTVGHVHVVGAGAMGGDIGAWCALHGLSVSLQDTRREAIAGALERAHRLYARRLREPRRVQRALDRLVPDERGDGLGRADLVLEAIVEQREAKQALFAEVERRAPREALLATNTSSIRIETLAEALARPERLVGLHFFNPVARMPLVEVVAGPGCDPAQLARARAFVGAVERLPLPVRSAPGFLVNRVLGPYLMEAVMLDAEGVPVTRIDRAAADFGMPMGPILLADTVGLDVCLAVAEVLSHELGLEVPERLRELVAAGRLGAKSGRGFYRHRGKKPEAPEDADRRDLAPIRERLVLALLNESVAALRESVVADAELVDAGLVFGAGFAPFRGGPMRYIETEGKAALLARLERLRQRHGARFAPDPGWESLGESLGAG